jgi:hypothetical protein
MRQSQVKFVPVQLLFEKTKEVIMQDNSICLEYQQRVNLVQK